MRLCAADDESEDAGLQALTHKDGDAVTRLLYDVRRVARKLR